MFNVLYKAFNIFYRISTNGHIPVNKVLSVGVVWLQINIY